MNNFPSFVKNDRNVVNLFNAYTIVTRGDGSDAES